ncbi:C-type lectin domain family 4 member G-like isoform X2 [Canis lupus baileyi]|uniref:C-type lectin domain-containing protein n=1 Tax=Canis lupus familiaris TaxID=9615 RepID=A0A8C0T7J6_CANLF|nr:C-type lectin domain family 4 member G isoform X1 [Canis lupus familiaris]XP_038282504.1 C-type lectin domain family 4 member G isoform X1 [Canis lupus familiaris]XP_038421231.1 C-type lectin domain family 4 member G isoform X1 [Canis lupus familiaris]|eukprot:XP_005632812.1 C-type lectin domain family 4 member G isoform X1 [Canis lupus familiaris]
MDEARHSPNPSEITALRAELPPQQGNTGQWGQTSQDKTWKYLCFFVSLILLLTVIILSVILSEVLKRTQQVQEKVLQLNEKVTQGLGDAGHDRDFIRSEVFRQMKAVLAGNESSCEPCPLDWKFFQGSCYFFSLDNLTWTQANDSCVQKQAHLVIINSRTEQDFLTSTGQVTSWIGLFKEGQKGNHRWMDGSTPTYINWDSKELPDNVTAPACMMMYNYGHWRDFSCESGQFAFICERRQNC